MEYIEIINILDTGGMEIFFNAFNSTFLCVILRGKEFFIPNLFDMANLYLFHAWKGSKSETSQES